MKLTRRRISGLPLSSKSGRDRSGVTLSSMPPTDERTGAVWKRGLSPGSSRVLPSLSRPHRGVHSTLQRASFKSSPRQYACPPVCIHTPAFALRGVVVLARELALDTDGEALRGPHLPSGPTTAVRRPVRRSSASAIPS